VPEVRYSKAARDDLIAIWLHVAQSSPSIADQCLIRIEARCAQLIEFPHLGPPRHDIADDARALLVDRWLILYRQVDEAVQIVRIVDGARDLTSLTTSND
jgi:toxin ParE1/3/4